MNDTLLALCAQHGDRKTFSQGQLIHQRGDDRPGLNIVQTGQVKVGNYGLDGQYQLTSYLQRGDSFGEVTLLVEQPRTHHSEAHTDVVLTHLNRQAFNWMNANVPEFNTYLLTSLAIKLNMALEMVDDHRRLPTHVRLAKLLYNQCTQPTLNNIKMRQSDCAELLAVTLLSSHNALNKLTMLNLVSTSYGAILVHDKLLLEQWLNDHLSLLPVKQN
jgi:CRP/FNR family cyclic AMP-dependent transcriptional regulator